MDIETDVYDRLPSTISAVQWDGSDEQGEAIVNWIRRGGGDANYIYSQAAYTSLDGLSGNSGWEASIQIRNGIVLMSAKPNDYIIQNSVTYYIITEQEFTTSYKKRTTE